MVNIAQIVDKTTTMWRHVESEEKRTIIATTKATNQP